MDSFNILIHADSNSIKHSDHELIVSKKLGTVLKLINYEVAVTHFSHDDNILTKAFGITLNNLEKSYENQIINGLINSKSISLKITDTEPESDYFTSNKFVQQLKSTVNEILKAHYVYFFNKLAVNLPTTLLRTNEIIRFYNKETSRFDVLVPETIWKKYWETYNWDIIPFDKAINGTILKNYKENFFIRFKSRIDPNTKVVDIIVSKQVLDLIELNKVQFKSLDLKTIKQLSKIYDEIYASSSIVITEASFTSEFGTNVASLPNNLEISINGLTISDENKRLVSIKDKSKFVVNGFDKSPIILSSEMVAYSYFNSKHLPLLYISGGNLPYVKLSNSTITGINIRLSLLDNTKRYFNTYQDNLLINLHFRKYNELE